MSAEKHDSTLLEIGNKLRNFRHKLAIAIGQKKIQQIIFGEMYGDYSERMIQSYEGGDSEIPARLFFVLWLAGNSVDAIFSEGEVTGAGRERAKLLYAKSVTAQLESMDDRIAGHIETSLLEGKHDKPGKTGPIAKGVVTTAGKRKGSGSAARKTKKR